MEAINGFILLLSSQGRNWDSNHTEEIIDNGPYFRPQDAITAGLADSIMYPDQFDDYVNSLNDEKVEIIKWKDIDRADDYVHEWAPEKKEKIAIIYAVGGIVSGKSNPGPAGSSIMGDETITKAIKSARENKGIKAIVLRIEWWRFCPCLGPNVAGSIKNHRRR